MSVDMCVHELFADQARLTPERIAISCGGREISYGELNADAGRLARRLREAGVRGNAPVGVLLERSAEFVVAILAVLKAGGCYVPLDPEYPTARLDTMLATAGVRLLISRQSTVDRLPGRDLTVVCVDEPGADAGAASAVPVHPDDLAYIMFTSGSTGTPKGVAVRHSGIVRLVHKGNFVRLGPNEVLANLSSPSFDASTFEIWGALANGARLVVGPPGAVSAQQVGELLHAEGVTCAWLTAGLFNVMVDECLDGLSGLSQLLTGGDVMSPSQARRFLEAVPDCRLINGYGPTEVTTFTTCYTVTPADTTSPRIPIGRPINGTRVEILDEDLRPVPAGTPGLLYAGGLGVARGYAGDAALTADRFVPDPRARGERLYATGDLAVLREDGVIDFLGRADQQVKKRGYRVEPAEVEEALRRDPLVKDAAVVLQGSRADEAVLVAYLVTGPATDAMPQIETRLRELLPDYLVPDRFVSVEALPLNHNGKVDRRALAALSERPDAVDGQPLTGTESALATIWCEILHLPKVGREDDFFALGGQSLQASRMAARIRSRLGVAIPLRTIFDHPTISELAIELDTPRAKR
jgi:amino acid adenylation domain-containing protein